ncbi:MAG: hypothetical protein HRU46_02175 [Verrucomicrobiales bacterium]|nr:hypothetical protein [Verrucomicrobiales bacterium]
MKVSFHRFILSVALSSLALSAGFAQETPTDLPAESALVSSSPDIWYDIFAKYVEAEYALLEPVRSLNHSFSNHLKKLVSSKQAEGNLAEVVEITEAIKALDNNKTPPEKITGSDLAEAMTVYHEALNERQGNISLSVFDLLKAYKTKLEELSTNLTRDGDIETALSIQTYIESWSEAFDSQESLAALHDPKMWGQINWDYVEAAVKEERVERIAHRAIDKTTNYDLSDQPSVLIGLKLNFDDIYQKRVVRGLQAIFRNRNKGEVTSDVSPGTNKEDTTRRVIAKDGYAVGAVEARLDPYVRQVRIHFYRIVGKQLNPDNSYSTEWYGNWPDGALEEKVDAGTKIPVGIHGRSGAGMDIIGLVVIKDA